MAYHLQTSFLLRLRLPMLYRFGHFELDDQRRELRLEGREVELQPRVFDVLAHLVRHHDRVVSKDELLMAFWSDTAVTDGSVQRAVSLARSALERGELGSAIRTYPRHGYRFSAAVHDEPDPAEPASTTLVRARDRFRRERWADAADVFREADTEDALEGVDLERWAYAARCAGRGVDAIGPLERAVAAYSMGGDRRGAARAALLLAEAHFERRQLAVAKGWHRRADRLLAGLPPSREHGLLEWLASRFATFEGHLEEGVRRAERALELGQQLGDPDLEALGLLYQGLAMLSLGDVERGTALQDEAAAAALAGNITPWVTGIVYCGVIFGCCSLGDWSRAAEWTDEYSRWCERSGLQAFPGLCRLHRAEVLQVRGALHEAAQEGAHACELLAECAPWAEGDAHRVLGEVSLALGDLGQAEIEFQRAQELGWDPQPGYALLHAAAGRSDLALRSLDRALADPGWAPRQRRGTLLAHLAVLAAFCNQIERARTALAELDRHPELWRTPALQALVAHARGELAWAEGRRGEGIDWVRRSIQHWHEVGSPLAVARLRLRLGQMLADTSDPSGAAMELSLAETACQKLGVPSLYEDCRSARQMLGAEPV